MTNEEIQNLIDQTDIVGLVSKYVSLTKKGKNYQGLCPFHNEKTPSFYVSPEKKIFNCFGCHKHGNALDFIEQIEGIEFKDALVKLCEFNGVKYKDNYVNKNANLNLKYYKIMEISKDFYKTFLTKDKSGIDAINYLKKRGLTDELIDKFDVGLSPDFGDTLYKVLKSCDYLELDMADMGLVENNSKGYYDIFSNRIMFPIKDEMGNVLGFSGRIFKGEDNSKYINSKETKIFRKGEVLFNINLAKPEMIKKHRAILHEGQMDVIASFRSGLGEAVCSLGTAFSDKQAMLLKKFCNEVVVCYDGDKAGITNSIKAINVFKRNGFKVYSVMLPDKMDPDEYVLKYGTSKYKEYFESHIIDSLEFEYEAQFFGKNLNDREVLNEVKNNVFEIISRLNSQIEIDEYLNKFKDKINSNLDAVKSDFDNYKNNHAVSNLDNTGFENYDPYMGYDVPSYNVPVEPDVKVITPKHLYNNICEIRLFRYAIESKSLALSIDEKIMNDLGGMTPENQNLWLSLIDYYDEFDEFDQGKFIKALNDKDVEQYITINDYILKEHITNDIDDIEMCIEKLKSINLDNSNKILSNKISSEPTPEGQTYILEKMFKNRKLKEQKENNIKSKKQKS
ncbi:MAG: DNA primase [Acholeplasmatales bacterium]|nr:DNA primase [Acholeplasmatales bacterium]